MNIITKLKRVARTGLVLGVISAAVIGVGLAADRATPVSAASSCDKVNVIYCGLSGSSLSGYISSFKQDYNSNDSGHASSPTVKHDYHDVQTIFNYVGASKTSVNAMSTSNTVVGAVHRNGTVTVGSKVIATNAMVAARFSVAGSKLIPGTNAYLRTTTSSFAQESEAAIIRMDSNGNMLYAAIIGCGNAVKATPKVTPKPSYTINKLVAVKGSTSFAKSVNVKPGTHVVYRITVASTGNAPVTNLTVKDKLPANVQYVSGTLKRDNAAASTTFFSTGVAISSLKNGTSTTFTFEGIVGPKDTPQACKDETLTNTSTVKIPSLPDKDSSADVTKKCLPKPTYACTSLKADKVSRTVFTFSAKAAAANGATITAYNFVFGDGSTKTVTSAAASTTAQHTYSAPGTYNAKVSVTFNVPGLSGPQTVTSDACATTVTVKEAPAAECTDLKLDQDASNPRHISVAVTFNATNGASLNNVSFNWDDGTTTDNGVKTTANHTYQKDGTFNVVATLQFSAASSELPASTCQAPVTVTTVMPTCDKLTVDVNNDDKSVTVSGLTYTANNGEYQSTTLNWGDNSDVVNAADVTGQTHVYDANGPFTIVATAHFLVNGKDAAVTSATCQQAVSFTQTPTPPETPPTELVNTGVGSVTGLFAAASAIGAVGYRFFLSRRLSRDS